MATGLISWSQTAATNATADSTVNFAEGQAPSSVNDSCRALMASAAKYRDDIAGAIVAGGTATAFTVSSYQGFATLAALNGQMIAFTPSATNTNAVGVDLTLNVDSLGAKPVRMQPNVPLPSGTLILGTPYLVTYNNSDAAFYLRNMTNPYSIPLGAGIDYWGSSTPNSCFAFPTGQAISRTTYATLFSLFGTTYGVGDGSTTFNMPDKTGRTSAMKEASATRLTSTYFGGNSANLGATGGLESNNVILTHTHVADAVAGHQHLTVVLNTTNAALSGSNSLARFFNDGSANSYSLAGQTNGADGGLTSVAGGHTPNIQNAGSASAHNVVQPTIVCNYIIRVI